MDSNNDFLKTGFSRLLKSFDSNTDDVVKLTRALGLATKVRRGQLFNKSEPYINHSLRVALILVEELQMRDVDLASAALLHDAQVPEQELQEYDGHIASIVSAAGQNAEEHDYAGIAKAPKEARYIKLAERLDVVRAMKNQAFKDKALRYKEETERYVMPIASATDDRLAFKLSVALYELK